MHASENSIARDAGEMAPPHDRRLLHHMFAHGVSDAEIAGRFRLSFARVAGLRAYYGMADRAAPART